MEGHRQQVDRPLRKPALTALQARVIARHASGLKLAEIAEEEYLDRRSIDRVVSDLKKRLGAKNLAQAALLSHAHGYITLPDDNGMVQSQSMIERMKS